MDSELASSSFKTTQAGRPWNRQKIYEIYKLVSVS